MNTTTYSVSANRCQYCGQLVGQNLGYFQPYACGCVCPPTAEQTCQSPACPRKNHFAPKVTSGTAK